MSKRGKMPTAICLAAACWMMASGQGGTAHAGVHQAGTAPEHARPYYETRGDIVWEVPGDDKVLALTFDDGPDPVETPQILDILQKYDARATFFAIGSKVQKHPEIVKREIAEGHEIANHTFTHRFLSSSSCSPEQIREEISRTQGTIFNATGRIASLFRPPGGIYNSQVLAAARREHVQTVLWSWHQDTRDWTRPGVGRIVRKVLRNARGGDIVLMHDHVSGTSQTVTALKIILPELKKQGYRFVTVSELMKRSKPVW